MQTRSAPSLLARAVLLGLLGVVTGCARSEAPPAPMETEVKGYWMRSFARASRLEPCGHGTHVWAWTPQRAGLQVVDANGERMDEEDSALAAVFQKDETAQVVDVIPTADPEYAWVHVRGTSALSGGPEESIYRVDHRGALVQLSLSLEELVLMPSAKHERLWVASTFNLTTFSVFDTAGGEEKVQLPPVPASQVTLKPVGDGRQGWLLLNQRLYQVDLQAKTRVTLSPGGSQDVMELIPTSRAQRAWVLAKQPGGKVETKLLQAGAARSKTASMPDTARRSYSHREGDYLWQVVSPAPSAAASSRSALKLVNAEGQEVGAGVELEGTNPTLVHSPDGTMWVRDTRRVYLLSDTGEAVAQSDVLPDKAELLPVSATSAWSVARDGSVRLLAVKGVELAVTASVSTGLRDPKARAWDAGGLWLLSDEETGLHRVQLGAGGLTVTQVFEGVGLGSVRPVAGTQRFWIAGTPRSAVYGPSSEISRVEVGFADGAHLERGAGGTIELKGPLVAGSMLTALELDWPGLAQAKSTGRTLRVEVRDERGEMVAQGLRRFVEPEGLIFQWTAVPGSAEHRYDIQVAHEVDNGSQLNASFLHVPFGVPVLERVWVRTALACVLLTLLLVLPLVLLRPATAPRRWMPLVGYGVSAAGVGGGEVMGLLSGLRIHLPTVLGVVGAEFVVCALLGLVSPTVFRRLVHTHPFSWAAAPLLRAPAFRRRFFAGYLRQVRRRVDVASAQANGEVFVELGALVVEFAGPGVAPSPSERTAEELCRLLTLERAHLFLQCAGGRGKSALLRQLVRLSLTRFVQRPSCPLPVFIDPAAQDLESAAKEALQDLGLPEALRDTLLESGDFFLVLDGLTESRLEPEALRRYLEREMGLHAPLLLSARPNEAYRVAMSHALRWMAVEPRRLDESGLARFQAAYPDASGRPTELSDPLRRICRGRGGDGTYVPLLVRLALRFGGGGVDSVINLYRAVFAGLLKREPDEPATSEMLAFAEALCLSSYWEHRSRLIVFRDHPDEHKLRRLLDAGLLVSADARPGPVPTHVRFFHDSMQSYLTARALYARHADQAHWDCLWRAAGEPSFAREQSDLMTEAGSELFQMCAYVFGYDARLRDELARHLAACAEANDERLTKETVLAAVPEALRESLRRSGRELGPGALLREASRVCAEQEEGEALFVLYARIAPRAWPWRPDGAEAAEPRSDAA